MTRVLPMCENVDPEMLLAMWEHGLGQPQWARADALLERAPATTRARTLGERNVRLIELHARLFGPTMDLLSHCPACGTAAEFSSDCEALAAQMQVVDETPSHRLDAQGHVIDFRLPDGADLAAASCEEAPEDVAQHLLDRCVLACTHDGVSVPVRTLPVPVLDALSQRMETLDPGASVSFVLECPQCAARWDAPLEVGQMVWQKVQAAAERLLLDIDTLARAYGWTEFEVLRLTPIRRAAYLQMVAA